MIKVKTKNSVKNVQIEPNSPDIQGATVENRYSKSMFNSGDSISNSQASEKILKKKGTGFNIASGNVPS